MAEPGTEPRFKTSQLVCSLALPSISSEQYINLCPLIEQAWELALPHPIYLTCLLLRSQREKKILQHGEKTFILQYDS